MNAAVKDSSQDQAVAARRVLGVAGLLFATGVMVGALGAHALRSVLDERQLASLDTAVDYQLFNALGLMVIGVLMKAGAVRGLRAIAALLVAGILCFSGGIYLMLAGAPRPLGLVTPVGGLLLITAWSWFAVAMFRRS
jgi:uncharacterized membrane protein YgdD (TMEM256/DUF423 family)